MKKRGWWKIEHKVVSDRLEVTSILPDLRPVWDQNGVTKEQFHDILDKASQPKKEKIGLEIKLVIYRSIFDWLRNTIDRHTEAIEDEKQLWMPKAFRDEVEDYFVTNIEILEKERNNFDEINV